MENNRNRKVSSGMTVGVSCVGVIRGVAFGQPPCWLERAAISYSSLVRGNVTQYSENDERELELVSAAT